MVGSRLVMDSSGSEKLYILCKTVMQLSESRQRNVKERTQVRFSVTVAEEQDTMLDVAAVVVVVVAAAKTAVEAAG